MFRLLRCLWDVLIVLGDYWEYSWLFLVLKWAHHVFGTFAVSCIDLNTVPVLCNAPWGHSCLSPHLAGLGRASPLPTAPPLQRCASCRLGVAYQHRSKWVGPIPCWLLLRFMFPAQICLSDFPLLGGAPGPSHGMHFPASRRYWAFTAPFIIVWRMRGACALAQPSVLPVLCLPKPLSTIYDRDASRRPKTLTACSWWSSSYVLSSSDQLASSSVAFFAVVGPSSRRSPWTIPRGTSYLRFHRLGSSAWRLLSTPPC